MRIVGGKHRSRQITFPTDANITRPTKDIVREGLFNALSFDVENATILDLFAGSGSLGLEALSRNAKYAYFVDLSIEANKIIKKNLLALNELNNAKILNTDYLSALNKFKDENIKFDIVFLDPPYKMEVIEEITKFLLDNEVLTKNGIIVIETDYHLDLDDNRFKKVKEYKYGKTYVTIKRR